MKMLVCLDGRGERGLCCRTSSQAVRMLLWNDGDGSGDGEGCCRTSIEAKNVISLRTLTITRKYLITVEERRNYFVGNQLELHILMVADVGGYDDAGGC